MKIPMLPKPLTFPPRKRHRAHYRLLSLFIGHPDANGVAVVNRGSLQQIATSEENQSNRDGPPQDRCNLRDRIAESNVSYA